MSRSRILAAMLSTGIENDEARPTEEQKLDENGNPVTTPADEPVAAEPAVEIAEDTEAAAVAEVADGAEEVAEVIDVVEELNEASEGLESLYIDIATARQDGGLSAQAFRGYNAAIESYTGRVGMTVATPSVESFGGATSRIHATVSLESGVIEKIREFIKKIIEAIKAAFRKVGDWFRKVTLGAERVAKRAASLKEKAAGMKNTAELEVNGKWLTTSKKKVTVKEAADELATATIGLGEMFGGLAGITEGLSDLAVKISDNASGAVKEAADRGAASILAKATSTLNKADLKSVTEGSGDEIVLAGDDLVGGKRIEVRYAKAADAAALGSFKAHLAAAPNFKPDETVKVTMSSADVIAIAEAAERNAKQLAQIDVVFRKVETEMKAVSSKLNRAADATLKEQTNWSAEDKAAASTLIRNAARPMQSVPGLVASTVSHCMAGFSGLLDIAAKAVSNGSKEKKAA